jgi:hypothetical protein
MSTKIINNQHKTLSIFSNQFYNLFNNNSKAFQQIIKQIINEQKQLQLPANIINIALCNLNELIKLDPECILSINNKLENGLISDEKITNKLSTLYFNRILIDNKLRYPYNPISREQIYNNFSSIKKQSLELFLEFRNIKPNQADISMLVIRPEFVHCKDDIIKFLIDYKFEIIHQSTKKINFKQYYNLYQDVVNKPKTVKTFPSRTLTYLSGHSVIIVFRDQINRYNPSSAIDNICDGFFKDFKGTEGVKNPNTIRGGVIYNSAKQLKFDQLDNLITNLALDPFGMIRQVINNPKETINTFHHRAHSDNYIMVYTSAGIHLPNNDEFITDFGTIFSPAEIIKITNILKKKQ